eukprot:TRINITY_DN144_c0_g1_i4.p1 TRINITY_DN144_c0_g1~~TRINITY_DN144_c0_g1_i4.p1  ORF type:complete len:269 (-),score=14.31 TRINITY_DN144_c0_g1_i4:491-1297(-)
MCPVYRNGPIQRPVHAEVRFVTDKLQRDGVERFLKYNNPIEHPVVVQFRGSNTERMAKAAAISASLGYDEVNINCGCPALKGKGKEPFGAVLMKDPVKVRDLVREMAKTCPVPITVKCRTGVDEVDSFDALRNFIATVKEGGVKHFIVHARKALLISSDKLVRQRAGHYSIVQAVDRALIGYYTTRQTFGVHMFLINLPVPVFSNATRLGNSPDGPMLNVIENRTIPPLKYEWVYQLAKEFPDLRFSINGGFKTIESVFLGSYQKKYR